MSKSYFNEKAAIWDERVAEKDLTSLENIAGSLTIEAGSTVLDVGTGTGVFTPFILSRLGENGKLVCLDFAEEMLKIFRSKGFEGNIEYICADIAASGLDDETFDAVVCYSSFPHFQDKPGALNEISRILKDDGRLYICHTSSRLAINNLHHRIPEVHNDHIPDEVKMRQLLSTAGFEKINIFDNEDSYLASGRKPAKVS
ncbi:class I SAM-dependent methyltransferase [Chloroflexota bacterium]